MAILKTFYPNDKRPWNDCIIEFNSLVNLHIEFSDKLVLDFENKSADYFITADIYVKNANLLDLYNLLSGKKEKDISLQKAKWVKDEFLKSVSHFKDKYEWIYNPPSVGKIAPWTLGKSLRQEFGEHYGAYAEITYLLARGDAMKFDEVNKMRLEDYLSLGEYLLRKRTVESVE